MKEYKNLVKALNRQSSVVDVNDYLKFSQASVCGKNILSVDIKVLNDNVINSQCEENIYIPGVHDQIFLNLSDTNLERVLKQVEELNLIENFAKLIQKINSYFSKSNVEFTIKAGKKPTTSGTTRSRKKKVEEVSEEATNIVATETLNESIDQPPTINN